MIKLKYHQGERSDISYAANGTGVDCTHCLATFPENSKNIKKYAGYCYLCDDCKTLVEQTKTVIIGGIEIILDLSKDLQHINITCNKIGNIYGDADTIFGDVNTVDGTVNLNVTGDVLGEVLSNIIYKSEIHLKGK